MINILCTFLDESNGEKFVKIDQYLVKLLTKNVVGFLTHTVDVMCIAFRHLGCGNRIENCFLRPTDY